MNRDEVNTFLEGLKSSRDRTMVVVDYGNVDKWQNSLRWKVGLRELGRLVKDISGKQFLRRFYYGEDCGPDENRPIITAWSRFVLETARNNGFEIISKKVKYIHDSNTNTGFEKKCDLDVEMAVDLIRERDAYDTAIIFSGDGDLIPAIQYLKKSHQKTCLSFGARGHIGREVYDAEKNGYISNILYAEDFEYRLNQDRFRH